MSVFTDGLLATISDPTKASDYNKLADNSEWLRELLVIQHSFDISTGTGAHTAITATTITGSGVLSITDATEATSTTAASIKTAGGIACAKDIYAGDDIYLVADGVLNWGAGDVTVTGGAGTLTFAGGTNGYVFNGTHASALVIGGATNPLVASPTMVATSNTVFSMVPTFTPSGASNDFVFQILPNQTLDNGGSQSCIYARPVSIAATKTLASAYAYRIADSVGDGTLTVQYGLYMDSLAKGATNYAIYTGASGTFHFGSLTASQDVQTDGSSNLTTVSDSRWKNDLGEIEGALEIVRKLKPRYFTWKRDEAGKTAATDRTLFEKQPRLAGFFAQEVYAALPEGSPGGPNVDADGEEHWGLNTRAIIAAMCGAIKELDAEVTALKEAA